MDQAEKLRELVARQAEAAEAPGDTGAPARVIVLSFGKGGVGKTNLSVNLALALADRHRRTILFDADLGMANVDVLLGGAGKGTLQDVLAGRKRLEEILSPRGEYLAIVPGGSGVAELARLDDAGVSRLVTALKTLEHQADFILVDTGAGIGPAVLNFALAADEVLLVTTPEPTALTDAYGLIKTLAAHNEQIRIRLLMNMVESELEARQIAERLMMVVRRFLKADVSYFGFVTRDPDVGRSVLKQQPFFEAFPHGVAARRMKVLASLLTDPPEGEAPTRPSGRFFQRLVGLFR